MIAKLRGFIDSFFEDYCIIDVLGVGYKVFISSKNSDQLKKIEKNKEVALIVETIVKEDAMELYGFLQDIEKIWFLELTKVQGVGNKVALKILSNFEIADITKAILSTNFKEFTKVPGIGPKLASRIVTELKDSPKRLGYNADFTINENSDASIIDQNQITNDCLSALMNLGYKKQDCQKIINYIIKENPDITLESLITNSLRELNKNRF